METSKSIYGINKLWWLPLISGVIFLGLGVWCLCAPTDFLEIMAYVFAGAFGAVGIFSLIYGICTYNTNPGWGWSVAAGVVEILFCFFLYFIPQAILAYVFVYGIGLYVIFMAIYSFFEYFSVSRYGGAFWFFWIIVLSMAAIAFAITFIVGPGAAELVGSRAALAGEIGPAVIGWLWMGISFLCYGAYRIILASRLKALNNEYKNGEL